MRMRCKAPFVFGLALIGYACESFAVALPTTFDQLLVPGATTSFNGNDYSTFQAVWGNGSPRTGPPTTSVAVSGVLSGSESGLSFSGVGTPLAFADTPDPSLAGTAFGGTIIYYVNAPAGSMIDDFTIAFTGSESGTSSVDVHGAVQDASFHDVGTFTFNAASGTAHVILSTPETEVRVFTSLTLDTGSPIFGGTSGSAQLDSLQETFSLSGGSGPPSVPEPGTLALMGIGVLGFVAMRRAKR